MGFRGHPMVRSLHPTTIEVTTEGRLTERGDCIIGVEADKGCAQLSSSVKGALRSMGSKVTIGIVVGPWTFVVKATGDPRLELSHAHDIVVRRSDFVSNRTAAVHADRASRDIPREMVRLLRSPGAAGRLVIEVETA